MEHFKLEIFNQEHAEPLLFKTVTPDEAIRKLGHILVNADFKDTDNFFVYLEKKLDTGIHVGTTDSMEQILATTALGYSPDESCYLIWDFPHHVDQFNLHYLIKHWTSIWYAGSDDAVVLVIENTAVILITHYGTIKYRKI